MGMGLGGWMGWEHGCAPCIGVEQLALAEQVALGSGGSDLVSSLPQSLLWMMSQPLGDIPGSSPNALPTRKAIPH